MPQQFALQQVFMSSPGPASCAAIVLLLILVLPGMSRASGHSTGGATTPAGKATTPAGGTLTPAGASHATKRPDLSSRDTAATAKLRASMVAEQISARGVVDEGVLAAMRRVPRHEFVPEAMKSSAYGDFPLPIGYGQTISQPYIVAFMTEAAALEPGEKILEIGTGSGYQAAVLAEIAAQVFTIEIVEPLGLRAAQTLDGLGYKNVRSRVGDGYAGWPEEAPFDAILVTAAPDHVPEPLVRQLREGGRIVIPVGVGFQELIVAVKERGKLRTIATLPVRFVPMTGKGVGGRNARPDGGDTGGEGR